MAQHFFRCRSQDQHACCKQLQLQISASAHSTVLCYYCNPLPHRSTQPIQLSLSILEYQHPFSVKILSPLAIGLNWLIHARCMYCTDMYVCLECRLAEVAIITLLSLLLSLLSCGSWYYPTFHFFRGCQGLAVCS